MFCSNCGKEIKVNSNFCEFCGHEVKKIVTEEKIQSKVNVRKKKPFIIGAIVIAVLIIGIVFVWEMNRVTTKNEALEAAKLFMEEKKYEPAIEAFNAAFAKGDNEPENYLLQAKAYVEMGDLYGAQQTLQLGYENTKSEDLLHVEIWGPTQPFDLFFYTEDWALPIRQRYVFTEDGIEAQFIERGRVLYTNKYYYDVDGKLIGCQLYQYFLHEFGGGDFMYLSQSSLGSCITMNNTGPALVFDFVYIGENMVEVWSSDMNIDYSKNEVVKKEAELVCVLYYKDGTCISAEMEEERIEFAYDEKGNLKSFNTSYGNVVINYLENGGYVISDNGDYVWEYDSNGLNTAYYGNLVEEEWRVKVENDHIMDIYKGENLVYRFTYNDIGVITKVEANHSDYEITGLCSYNEKGQLKKVEFQTIDGETLTRSFYYNKEGRVEWISQENDSLQFTYDDNGRCINYTLIQEDVGPIIETIIYDDLGRVIGTIRQ